MANAYINYYINNPTPGGTDGTTVSLDDAETQPITAALNASGLTSLTQAVALRCTDGFETSGAVNISFTGTTAGKWSVSDSQNGTYASSLTLATQVGNTNVVFWVKASASNDESPANDTSVNIVTTATIVPTA